MTQWFEKKDKICQFSLQFAFISSFVPQHSDACAFPLILSVTLDNVGDKFTDVQTDRQNSGQQTGNKKS